jgi:sporulation protein YlmC with PRC-barrel domain
MNRNGMIEKRVIDSEGVELGVVSKEEEKCIEVSEGLFDELLLARSYIGEERDEEVVLRDSVQNLLAGLDVIDSKGEQIGSVRETVSAGDVLDSLILDVKDGELLFITLEEIYKIDKAITLDIDLEEVRYRQKTHTLRDHIKHSLERLREK